MASLLRTAGLVLAALTAACSPAPKVDYQAYSGTAYPNRAPKIAWPASAALVTNSYADSLSVVDLASGKPIFTRPIGRNPVDLDGPHHVAIDPVSRTAFTALSYPRVAASGPHASHGSALIPGYVQKLSLDDLSIVGNVRVDDNPGDIVMSDDKTRLVVSHFDLQRAQKNPTDLSAARATIAIVDPTKISMIGSAKPTFITTCVAPHGVALLGSRAFVACYGEDSLAIVDLDHPDQAPELVPVAPGVSGFGAPTYGPYAAVLSPDKSTLAVSDTESHDVRFFDVASKSFKASATLSVQGSPYFTAWSADGKTLYVPTQQPDALLAIPLDGSPSKSVAFDAATCTRPHVVTLVGARLYVVCEGDHSDPTKPLPGSLVVLDASLSIASSSALGPYPDAFTVMPAGFQ